MKPNLYMKSALGMSGQCGVFSMREFRTGEVVLELSGEILTAPTRTSIQMGESLHVEDDIGSFINHSGSPTCRIDGAKVVAIKNINKDEEITFNYSDNEDVLAAPFVCSETGEYISGKKG